MYFPLCAHTQKKTLAFSKHFNYIYKLHQCQQGSSTSWNSYCFPVITLAVYFDMDKMKITTMYLLFLYRIQSETSIDLSIKITKHTFEMRTQIDVVKLIGYTPKFKTWHRAEYVFRVI